MARFDERSGQLYVTELGRVASHFYIRHASIVAFNKMLRPHMSEAEVRCTPRSLQILPDVHRRAGAEPAGWQGPHRRLLGGCWLQASKRVSGKALLSHLSSKASGFSLKTPQRPCMSPVNHEHRLDHVSRQSFSGRPTTMPRCLPMP